MKTLDLIKERLKLSFFLLIILIMPCYAAQDSATKFSPPPVTSMTLIPPKIPDAKNATEWGTTPLCTTANSTNCKWNGATSTCAQVCYVNTYTSTASPAPADYYANCPNGYSVANVYSHYNMFVFPVDSSSPLGVALLGMVARTTISTATVRLPGNLTFNCDLNYGYHGGNSHSPTDCGGAGPCHYDIWAHQADNYNFSLPTLDDTFWNAGGIKPNYAVVHMTKTQHQSSRDTPTCGVIERCSYFGYGYYWQCASTTGTIPTALTTTGNTTPGIWPGLTASSTYTVGVRVICALTQPLWAPAQ